MTDNPFVSEDFDVPEQKSRYMKFEQGDNKFRLLEKPIVGWMWWEREEGLVKQSGDKPLPGDKPVRIKNDENAKEEAMGVARRFWAMVVWNYQTEAVEILEITQRGIQKSINALARSKDWGSPFDYDIVIEREGEKLETTYSVRPSPKKELKKEIKETYKEAEIKIEALYKGEDPFAKELSIKEKEVDEIFDDVKK